MRLKRRLLRVGIAFIFLPVFLPLVSRAGSPGDPPGTYFVGARGIGVVLTPDGTVLRIRRGRGTIGRPVVAFSGIAGCRQQGGTIIRRNKEGVLQFSRILVNDSLHRSCLFIERFIPAGNSIRWELEIRGRDQPWSAAINTVFEYPATRQTRFWTSWGAPQYDSSAADESADESVNKSADESADKELRESLRPVPGGSEMTGFIGPGNNQWVDPLVAVPFTDRTYYYGLPYFTYEDPRIAVCPFQGNLFCIPMCSILEPHEDAGLTFALSPEDDLVDLVMNTNRKGDVRFSRLFNRISRGHSLRFSMDITAHAADWRAGLGWVATRYPGYFKPKNKRSFQLAGTGAYAGPFEVIENQKMREMDFTTNWQSSFDFPYMGMFLPPVKRDQSWKRFGDSTISMSRMDEYARRMKMAGFHVLNYFNVTEFGAKVKDPAPPADSGPSGSEADDWKDCNIFLYRRLPHAIFPVPLSMKREEGDKTRPGGPLYTWEGGIVMDCGDPAYKDFLLKQALRHIREIPNADGICIDRMDWLRMFNERADDGKTWFGGKPVRSLIHSFKQLMDTLGPMMHHVGKNIFVNNHDKRIDLLEQADGIFDEFTYAGAPLNLSALLCVEKPALGWTDAAATVRKEGPDNFFQKYLYMGVFPMCPYPANDHSIMPDSLVDGYYIDYAPLLRLMRGREWVLRPHVVAVENNLAKANLFKTPGGYIMPVVYGKANRVRVYVQIRQAGPGGEGRTIVSYKAWYPGKTTATPLHPIRKGGVTILEVPLVRGCAMISCSNREK